MSTYSHDATSESDGPSQAGVPLSRRQREVAACVAEALTNAEIAQRLVLSPGTVANHVAMTLKRLGLRSRTQLAVWAVEHGLYWSS